MKSRHIALPLGILFCALPGFAQMLEGLVKGKDGLPLKGALIRIEREDGTGHYQVTTNTKGSYLFVGLPIGQFKITLEVDGKDVASIDKVRTALGDPVKNDFDLQALAQRIKDEEGGIPQSANTPSPAATVDRPSSTSTTPSSAISDQVLPSSPSPKKDEERGTAPSANTPSHAATVDRPSSTSPTPSSAISDQAPPSSPSTQKYDVFSLSDNMSVRYDANKWKPKPGDRPVTAFVFVHYSDNCIGEILFIAKNTLSESISTEIVAEGFLGQFARDPSAKIIIREKRRVNGVDVLFSKSSKVLDNSPTVYCAYSYGDKNGSIVVLAYTGLDDFDAYEKDMMEFLNGLAILP